MKWRLLGGVVCFAILLPLLAAGQTSFDNTGNWNVAGNWAGNNIADLLTEDATISNNQNPTVISGDNYTVGNVTGSGTTTITINAGGTLSIGQAGTPKNLSFNNNSALVVAGTLYIFGDLIVGNSLALTITGTVRIYGNIDMGNSGTLNVSGGLTVDGDVTGGNNSTLNVSAPGTINIGGDLNTGNGSSVTGPPGSISVGGSCNSTTPGFCSSGALPIQLIFFNARQSDDAVEVSWATASEVNVDYFVIEKSATGLEFEELGRVEGSALSTERLDYYYVDFTPASGAAYYRLKEVDLDGYTKYFSMVRVFTEVGDRSWLYPNPVVDGKMVIELNFQPDGEAVISDLAGVELLRTPLKELKTDLSLPLNPGTYLIQVQSGSYNKTSRFVVQ